MSRIIRINSCAECDFREHSGAFTPGGAIPLCAKVPDSTSKYRRRELPWTPGTDKWNGRPTRVATEVIPDWCPLERD